MPESLNILELITGASLLVQIVMALLLLASLVCWVIIFRLALSLDLPKALTSSLSRGFGPERIWLSYTKACKTPQIDKVWSKCSMLVFLSI